LVSAKGSSFWGKRDVRNLFVEKESASAERRIGHGQKGGRARLSKSGEKRQEA